MRNWETQQQFSSALGAVVTTACTKHCVFVWTPGVLLQKQSLRIVPGCYCSLVKSVPWQNLGWWHYGASSVMGSLSGLSAVASPCLSNLLGNEIFVGFFFFSKCFPRVLHKRFALCEEKLSQSRKCRKPWGMLETWPKVALVQQSRGTALTPEYIMDSMHRGDLSSSMASNSWNQSRLSSKRGRQQLFSSETCCEVFYKHMQR